MRTLVLLGLFYILFRLLIDSGKRVNSENVPPVMPAEAVCDVLKEDPVCRTLIPARQAITLKNNGKTLYFCSSDCRSKFITSQGDHRA